MDHPVVIFVIAVTCAIIVLTIFFTFWGALFNKSEMPDELNELAKKQNLPGTVNVELECGKRYESVEYLGTSDFEECIYYNTPNFIGIKQKGKMIYLKPESIKIIGI